MTNRGTTQSVNCWLVCNNNFICHVISSGQSARARTAKLGERLAGAGANQWLNEQAEKDQNCQDSFGAACSKEFHCGGLASGMEFISANNGADNKQTYDLPSTHEWLQQRDNWMSYTTQNKILKSLAHIFWINANKIRLSSFHVAPV